MTNTGNMYWALIGWGILATFVGILVYEAAKSVIGLF
jgi:hypothetical protein